METKGTTQEKGVSGGIKRVGGQWGVHPSHDICNTLSQIFYKFYCNIRLDSI